MLIKGRAHSKVWKIGASSQKKTRKENVKH